MLNRSPLLACGARPLRTYPLDERTLPPGLASDHGLGLQHRTRVRGAIGLDADVRPRRDLPPRDARSRPADARSDHGPAEAAGEGPRPLGGASGPRARWAGLRSGE